MLIFDLEHYDPDNFDPDSVDLAQFDALLSSYDYETDVQPWFKRAEMHIMSDISEFGRGINNYGEALHDHLIDTSEVLEDFLPALGYSDIQSHNLMRANLPQDLGKTAFDAKIWHTATKAEAAPYLEQRARHPLLGPVMLRQKLEALGIDKEHWTHPHIQMICLVQLFHHEKINGSGPFERQEPDISPALESVCIIDAWHGDHRMTRANGEPLRTEEEAIRRMCGFHGAFKYAKAFRADTMAEFIKFREKVAGIQVFVTAEEMELWPDG